uniref:(northern house mosquito) hypothetical protein n=1 Tax=Culex pipiens TaxID=7175 RepID=A0A8D8CY53_CULPI
MVYITKSNFARKRVIITSNYCCFWFRFCEKFWHKCFSFFFRKRFQTTLLLSGFKIIFSLFLCFFLLFFQIFLGTLSYFNLKIYFPDEKNPASRSFVCVRLLKMKIGK